jgi:hypothetical protein
MSKLPLKLKPPKNFKYKYLFGDKIPKRDGAYSNQIHDDVALHVLLAMKLAMEPHCEVWTKFWHKKTLHLSRKEKKPME